MKQLICVLLICLSSTLSAQVVDKDGNNYKTVKIGNQVWFAENLRTSKYNDGTPIPNVTDSTSWSNLNTGAYCFYDNNAANNATYGKLYNWYAVKTDKLCPTGWHVPTDAEWTVLETYLGAEAGKKMKSTSGWSENGNGTNSSGFSGLPGGFRNYDGTFDVIGYGGDWWSSTEGDTSSAWFRGLFYDDGIVYRVGFSMQAGFSVRCLRD